MPKTARGKGSVDTKLSEKIEGDRPELTGCSIWIKDYRYLGQAMWSDR